MDMRNVTPTPDESQVKIAKYEMISRVVAPLIIVFLGFFTLILILARQQLAESAPWLLYFFEFCLALLVLGSIIGFFKVKHDEHQARMDRYRHNTYRFQPSDTGNYDAYFNGQTFIQAVPGNFVQPVPQSLTYSPHITMKGESRELPGSNMQALPLAKPTIADMVAAVNQNGYEIALGRSLTTQQPILATLSDAHIKLIGGTRMGKSCEAAAILNQVCETHDTRHMQIALLDLENKTSRLFAGDSHVLMVDTGYKKVKMHARDIGQVATGLIVLHGLMIERYKLTDAQLAQMPHILIYLEEFLYWKKLLKQKVDAETREKALASFSGLATRCIKVNMHLMACAQADYADEELRDAMAQFIGVNLSFAVKPSAAQAAGFVSSDLLKQNYEARTPGQFVVEMIGGADLGLAPDFNVKQKLAMLPGSTVVAEVPDEMPEPSQNLARTQTRTQIDAALQAKVEQVMQNPGESQDECILRVWNARKGGGEKYKQAKQEYIQVLEIIHAMARKGMDA